MPLPITLLTGFLGAGKTTLLNHLLSEDHGLRLALIVNDFGTINIDARLIKSVEGDTIALSNGCICCDRRANLRLTIEDLLARPEPPEYAIVEASGIADPLALAAAFRTPELQDRARLDGVITVVDAEHARNPRLDAQLIRDQLIAADIILLNKTDLVTSEQRAGLAAWIAGINRRAPIVETVQCRVPPALLLGLDAGQTALGASTGSHHSHSLEAATWSYSRSSPLDLHRLLEALKALPPAIFRVKGIVRFADAPGLCIALHMVGRRINTEILGRWGREEPRTELVFIGSPGGTTQDQITALLDACVRPSPSESRV